MKWRGVLTHTQPPLETEQKRQGDFRDMEETWQGSNRNRTFKTNKIFMHIPLWQFYSLREKELSV